jgi:type I restriction enzyme, S subunit
VIGPGPSLLRLADYVNGHGFGPDDLNGDRWPVVRIRHLLDASAEPDRTDLEVPKVRIDDGDLIFSWSATLAARIWEGGPALLNQHLFRVDPQPEIDRGWLMYVLAEACRRLESRMHGSAMTHITRDMMREVTVGVPSKSAQRAISNFLDTETTRIDALIAKKQCLLDLAEQRIRSAFENAVEISGWPRPALSHLLARRVSDGPHETPEFRTEGVPFLSVDAFVDNRLRFEGCRRISTEDHQRYSRKARPQRGDVLMTKAASIGRVAVVETDTDFNVWSPVAILRPNQDLLRSDYLAHVLRSDDLLRQMALAATSNTQQNLAMADIGSLRVPLPPVATQKRIAEAADAHLRWEREVRQKTSSQIELLREHRQSLITAAVTGKLEVPGVAA